MDQLFDFELPDELIAQEPARPRDHARLLIYNRETQKIRDDYFYNLANYLPIDTTIVVNNSKVENCRYLFDTGKMEIFAVESVNDRTIRALVRPGRRFKLGNEVELEDNISVTVTNIDGEGIRTLQFNTGLDDEWLIARAHVPLPPYIEQNDRLAGEYQTVYARQLGSLAAPTAGLHFTPELVDKLKKQFGWAELELQVGLGTFASLKQENFSSGKLHSERFSIPPDSLELLQSAKHITAVGTTSLRAIETAAQHGWKMDQISETDIFIRPGFEFRRVNSLITNFHLPSTSLLLLVEAFLGSRQDIERVYQHAIKERYRFYSFGDGMLVI